MNEDDDKVVAPDVEYRPVAENDDPIVVCKSCRNIQDGARVMATSWYKQGILPPCQRCGGVTMEIPTSAYAKFRKDSENGKRFT